MKEVPQFKYLNININPTINESNFVEFFSTILSKNGSKIYTINPEFIVDAFYDDAFKKELNSSQLNVVDGVGLLFGIKMFSDYKGEVYRFTGVDLVEEILKISNERKLSLFILGGSKSKNVSERCLQQINKRYPNINVIGGSSDFSYKESDDIDTLKFIHNEMKKKSVKKIDILLVGYGHKKQEFWISRNAAKIPALVSIGVGGTLDYISGEVLRAPKFIRKLGLEWLFRLILNPKRILRIFKATFVFLFLSVFKFNSTKKR